jgi:hypothetical protein
MPFEARHDVRRNADRAVARLDLWWAEAEYVPDVIRGPLDVDPAMQGRWEGGAILRHAAQWRPK